MKMCCFPTLRLFFLSVASTAYSDSNIKLVLNTNIELSINPERFSQRQGYGPRSPNKQDTALLSRENRVLTSGDVHGCLILTKKFY